MDLLVGMDHLLLELTVLHFIAIGDAILEILEIAHLASFSKVVIKLRDL